MQKRHEVGGQHGVCQLLCAFNYDQHDVNPKCVTFILADSPLTQTNNTDDVISSTRH